MVGEKGPELFVPDTAGTVVPNDKMGRSVVVNYSPNIRIDSRTDQAQIAALVQSSVRSGNVQLVQHLRDAGAIA